MYSTFLMWQYQMDNCQVFDRFKNSNRERLQAVVFRLMHQFSFYIHWPSLFIWLNSNAFVSFTCESKQCQGIDENPTEIDDEFLAFNKSVSVFEWPSHFVMQNLLHQNHLDYLWYYNDHLSLDENSHNLIYFQNLTLEHVVTIVD